MLDGPTGMAPAFSDCTQAFSSQGPTYILSACAVAVSSIARTYADAPAPDEGNISGLRGTSAVPFYRYVATSLSHSEYQLKPNPNHRPQQM